MLQIGVIARARNTQCRKDCAYQFAVSLQYGFVVDLRGHFVLRIVGRYLQESGRVLFEPLNLQLPLDGGLGNVQPIGRHAFLFRDFSERVGVLLAIRISALCRAGRNAGDLILI